MARKVHEAMTEEPLALAPGSPLVEAARRMRDEGIGDVIVADEGMIRGILTDRDIVVRAVAEGLDVADTSVGQICSDQLTVVGPDDDLAWAVQEMRKRAIRRLPVCDGERLVGVLSLGDLAAEQDPSSALGEISSARPNG